MYYTQAIEYFHTVSFDAIYQYVHYILGAARTIGYVVYYTQAIENNTLFSHCILMLSICTLHTGNDDIGLQTNFHYLYTP